MGKWTVKILKVSKYFKCGNVSSYLYGKTISLHLRSSVFNSNTGNATGAMQYSKSR